MLMLRPVEFSDAPMLYRWRFLDKESVANSLSPTTASASEHIGWLCERLAKGFPMWIGMNFQTPVGYIGFFPYSSAQHFVSLVVAPEHRRKGFGQTIVSRAVAALPPPPLPCIAEIRNENEASKKIFTRCGFSLIEESRKTSRYRRDHSHAPA